MQSPELEAERRQFPTKAQPEVRRIQSNLLRRNFLPNPVVCSVCSADEPSEDYETADQAQIERDGHERQIAEETGQYDPSVGLGRSGTDWE